jgi:hypothetical protein
MRPKVTYRKGPHPSRVGEIIPDDTGDDWLSKTAELYRHMIKLSADDESSANIRETLRCMATIDDDAEASIATDQCDETTLYLLTKARYLRRAASDEGTAAGLRADAGSALANWEADAGGRPRGPGRELAAEALREWTRRTGDTNPGVFWHGDLDPPCTPVVELAGAVFDAVYSRHYDRSTVAELLREVLKAATKTG